MSQQSAGWDGWGAGTGLLLFFDAIAWSLPARHECSCCWEWCMQLNPRSLRLLILILLISPGLLGQDTASLTSTVTDATSATITDAQITVNNVGKGIHRTTSTNAAGEYLVSGLPPAHYDAAISAPGFAPYNVKNVVLGVAQTARLDAKLQVGPTILPSGINRAMRWRSFEFCRRSHLSGVKYLPSSQFGTSFPHLAAWPEVHFLAAKPACDTTTGTRERKSRFCWLVR